MSLLPIAALLMALAARPAPSPEEQRLFTSGLAAFDAGDARAAERDWKAGYAVARDPAFLVRIGEAQEKAGAPAEAAESYRRYLHEAPDASDRADIEQRVARLAPPRAGTEGAAPVEPVGELGTGATPTLPTAPAPRAEAAVDSDAARAQEEDEGWTGPRIAAWSATGATVALLGAAAYFGAQASSKASDANRLVVYRDRDTGAPLSYTPDVARQYETALADGRSNADTAKLLLIGAAGTAAIATVFFVINGTRAEPGHLAVAPTSGRGAVGAWTWTF